MITGCHHLDTTPPARSSMDDPSVATATPKTPVGREETVHRRASRPRTGGSQTIRRWTAGAVHRRKRLDEAAVARACITWATPDRRGQAVAQAATAMSSASPLRGPLAGRGEQVSDRLDRGRNEPVVGPHATLLPLQQAGLGEDTQVVTHGRLRQTDGG